MSGPEIGNKAVLQQVADALQMLSVRRMPAHLNLDDAKVTIDIFPLLFPNHVYNVAIAQAPVEGSGEATYLIPAPPL